MKTLILILLATAAISMNVVGQDDTRSGQTWKVQHYDLAVKVPSDERTRKIDVAATLKMKNVSGKPASSLTLRISQFAEIMSIKVNGSDLESNKSTEKVNAAISLQRTSVRIPAVQANSVITAVVEYKLEIKDNSGVVAMSPSELRLLPTSFWYPTPTSWFFSRGGDTAPFKVTVVGGRGELVSAGTAGENSFETKVNGRPFLLTGDWDRTESAGVSIYLTRGMSSNALEQARSIAALFNEARTFVASKLGKAPDDTLRIVSVRRGGGFSGGGTLLLDDAVFRRSKIDSQTAMSVTEAAVKMWLGESVTVSGDGYGIIQEGLSRYIATQFIESKYGKDIADIERGRQRTAYASISQRDLAMTKVAPIDDFYFPEVANKGAMAWRLLAKRFGEAEFDKSILANVQDGFVDVNELRMAFAEAKPLIDYLFDENTAMNLMAGLPQSVGGETKVALRNTGAIDATVNVSATMANGEKIVAPATIRSQSFGEVIFKTPSKISRVEVDVEKLYPQVEYADDVAPKELSDNDPVIGVKRYFDKKDYTSAEKATRNVLAEYPRFDDIRTYLGRSLNALGRSAEAEREFQTVLNEKLPTPRSLAWANLGLAEIAARANKTAEATKYADAAINADGEYGASLAARALRNKIGGTSDIDPEIKTFFASFDSAAASNRKSEVDGMVLAGEVTKFAAGIAGSTEQWSTKVIRIDRLGPNTVLAEVELNIKLLTKDAESGYAVYRLQKVGSAWKLSGVDIFEVR